jgi:tRNA pseudouridine13 synthase
MQPAHPSTLVKAAARAARPNQGENGAVDLLMRDCINSSSRLKEDGRHNMKLKQRPEDFHVEELTDVQPTGSGPHALYQLQKRGWTTPDALEAIRKRWRIDYRRISLGGLKDRHALTTQHLTIERGPNRNLTHTGIRLEYLGRVPAPFTSKDITANRFEIVLRDLSGSELRRAESNLEEIRQDGVPNYFDDQRFGSVLSKPDAASNAVATGESRWIAKLLVQGRFEEALRQVLTAPYEFDRAAQKRAKAALRQHWGDWPACKKRLARGESRRLVEYLEHHPDDFPGAVQRLRPEWQGLYLSAYQSHLWNKMLGRWLVAQLRPEQILQVETKLGVLPMHRRLEESQRLALGQIMLPLPSARLKIETGDPLHELVHSVVAEEGLRLEEMKVKGMRKPFFSKGDRRGLCLPENLTYEKAEDEFYPSRQKLTLKFELGRGSYATLIVKRALI